MSYVLKWHYHVSSRLMDEISKEPIKFEGSDDDHAIAVFVKLAKDLELCDLIGEFEHSNDWDPYIEIDLKDGTKIATPPGYYYFDISEMESRGSHNWKDPKDFEFWLPTEDDTPSTRKHVLTVADIKEIRVFK